MTPIESAKKRAISEMEMFLRNFAKVPDDKLNYTPTPTAKSPLRIAAHTALYAGRFAQMIRDRQLPNPTNIEEWMAEREAEELAVTSREQAEQLFRDGTDQVLAALDSLSPDEINLTLNSDQGFQISMQRLIDLPGWHATLHTGQIDFLQTCWGDQHIYVG